MKKTLLMLTLFSFFIFGNAFAYNGPTVTVTGGAIEGRELPAPGGAVFKGIPFAAPPVGGLRWKEPQPIKPWAGTLKTVEFGAPCSQRSSGWNDKLAAAGKEDCLFLNVWTSPWPTQSKKPVMVWIHGGANMGGSALGLTATEPSFDGERLSRRGVVVVSIHYRLGVFGFMAHPELSAESAHQASGNYGIMDQIAALKWVRDNISKFGGDPSNVTVFGQSAGAEDLGMLMISPLARGLFHKAIAESWPGLGGGRTPPALKEVEQAGVALAQKMNAPATGAINFLRSLPAEAFVQTSSGGGTAGRSVGGRGGGGLANPNIDGYVIAKSPTEVFRAGEQAPVPFIVGNNGRERTVRGGTEELKTTITGRFGAMADKVIKMYEAAPVYAPWGNANAQYATDAEFRCSAVLVANWHSAKFPTWEYEFTRAYEPDGATHSWELQYVFGNLLDISKDPLDRKLSDQMQIYWTNFAKTGNPNGNGLLNWPKHDPSTKSYLEFAADGPVVKKALREPFCSLFSEKMAEDKAKALQK
jgi:para-nitrobenzyl esterase